MSSILHIGDYTSQGCVKETSIGVLRKMPSVRKMVLGIDGLVKNKAFVEARYKDRPALVDRITGTVYDGALLRPFFSQQLQIIGDAPNEVKETRRGKQKPPDKSPGA